MNNKAMTKIRIRFYRADGGWQIEGFEMNNINVVRKAIWTLGNKREARKEASEMLKQFQTDGYIDVAIVTL